MNVRVSNATEGHFKRRRKINKQQHHCKYPEEKVKINNTTTNLTKKKEEERKNWGGLNVCVCGVCVCVCHITKCRDHGVMADVCVWMMEWVFTVDGGQAGCLSWLIPVVISLCSVLSSDDLSIPALMKAWCIVFILSTETCSVSRSIQWVIWWDFFRFPVLKDYCLGRG